MLLHPAGSGGVGYPRGDLPPASETDEPVGVITLSAGIAALAGKNLNEAIADADALMYDAKRAGRNRVACERAEINLAA